MTYGGKINRVVWPTKYVPVIPKLMGLLHEQSHDKC